MRSLPPVLAWIVPAIVAAGCGFDPEGGTDAPDAPPDAPRDSDGDGLLDGADNCPMISNATQYDEDGDSVGDACDNCPHVNDSTQANSDGDGVGDACDPDPAAPNHIAAFHGFNGTGFPPGWSPNSIWNLNGGVLRQPSIEIGDRILRLDGLDLTDMVVDTSISVVGSSADMPPLSALRSVSVLTRYQPGDIYGTGYLCSAFQSEIDTNNATQISTRYRDDGSVVGGDADAMPVRMSAGRSIRIIASSSATTHSCQTATSATVSSTFQDATHASGTVALRTYGVAANFAYVVVIAPGP